MKEINSRDPDAVTASEIAAYVYCPESWRLGRSLGRSPGNQAELARGEKVHEVTATVEQSSKAAIWVGAVLIVLGLLVLAVYVLNQ